jgi:WXXGXW repeat (2 copies)
VMITSFWFVAAAMAGPSLAAAAEGAGSADAAPPPARVERAAQRDGYVWAPGYWDWNGHAYHWVSGSYIYERRGAHWVADRWEQVGSQWQHVRGHWES